MAFSLATALGFLISLPAHADTSGLWMSSSRQTITSAAGNTTSARVKIANKTNNPMDVQLSVKSFNVDPQTRAVTFVDPRENWITPHIPQVALAPSQEQDITYRIAIPVTAEEKEYHFALIASTPIGSGQNTKTLRVASLLYLSIDRGHLARASTITAARVPSFALGSTIPYTFAINNTGDIHLDLQSNVQLQGQTWNSPVADQPAVVLPGESRTVSDRISAPLFPGVYTLRYGYTDETTGTKTLQVVPVIYIPVWSVGVLITLLLASAWFWQRRHKAISTSDQ